MALSACTADNDRDLTRGYNTPDGLAPYTYDNNRDGMNFNRYDNGDYRTDNYGFMDNRGRDRFNANRYNTYRNNGDNVDRFNANNTNRFRTNANQDAERLASQAAKINGVDDATVVIVGRTAYVALDLKDRVDSRQATRVERSVRRSLEQASKRYNISITSDADLYGRLRDIGDGIRNGTPAEYYRNDFDRITNQNMNRTGR